MTSYYLEYSLAENEQEDLIRTLREAAKANHEAHWTKSSLEKWAKFIGSDFKAHLASYHDFGKDISQQKD